MERTTISKLKNSLSAYLRKVKLGESILVMERNTPVARLVPIDPSPEGTGLLREEVASYSTNTAKPESDEEIIKEEMIRELIREGRLIPGKHYGRRSPLEIIRAMTPPKEGISLLEAVLAEREEERRCPYR